MYFDQKECGQRIKELIRAYGMTQTDFAERLNTSPSYMRKILSGSVRCSLDLLIEISCLLNVSLDYVLLGKGKEEVDLKNELLEIIGDLSQIAKKL